MEFSFLCYSDANPFLQKQKEESETPHFREKQVWKPTYMEYDNNPAYIWIIFSP